MAIVPAITTYLNMGVDVPTPGVRTGFTDDVYLTLEQGSQPGDTEVTIQAFVRPMILWLWIGGLVMAIGTLLAAFPGSRRRRAIDPVSAPIGTMPADDAAGVPTAPDPEVRKVDDEPEPEPEPAGVTA